MLCFASDSDGLAIRPRVPSDYDRSVVQLFGSSAPDRRCDALVALRSPDAPRYERGIRAHLTALTDPSDEVRTAAMRNLIPVLVESDGEVALDAGGKFAPANGGVLAQFIRLCVDPPICRHTRSDPRWDGSEAYDPRYAITTTRVMFLRAMQYSAPSLPGMMAYVRQESEVALSAVEHQRDLINSIYPAEGCRLVRNVLGLSLDELPARLRDGSLSPLATVSLLYAAGLSQSSNRYACPVGEHLKGKIGVGIWNTFVDVQDFAPALGQLPKSLQSFAPRRYRRWD